MFTPAIIDVEVRRTAEAQGLEWPRGIDAETDSGLGCNREYMDFRGMTWRDFEEVRTEERKLIARLLALDDADEALDAIEEEAEEANEPDPLLGLDVGIASSVIALSAARCTPVASCNGGVFGGRHHEHYPLVLFCARSAHLPLLHAAAEKADVGLVADHGYLVAYSGDIHRMQAFADELSALRREFRELRFARPGARRSARPRETPEQLTLL